MKNKYITNNHSLPSITPKPHEEEIQATWIKAEETAKSLLSKRMSGSKNGTAVDRHISNTPWSKVVDPDILSYLLSGMLFHYSNKSSYHADISGLAMDTTPYRSNPDLQAHSSSYLQLMAILPFSLLNSTPPAVCQSLINAASHNSFGIRSGSEDGDEYLGYGLYPGASYFNHSCQPNIGKKRLEGVWEFRALNEIAEGEECCITYLGGDEKEMTVVERRSRLKAFWGFECMCRRCKDESGTA
jgi:SET and MYND domain-containing protein